MHEKQHALRTPDSDAARRAPIVVQRKCGCGGSCGSCSDDKKKKKSIQRRALGDVTSEVPRSVGNVLGAAGRPLDAGTRASMESRFGQSFAHVRVHTDTHAAESAKEIDAAAYTSGTHIVFGAGRFAPETPAGRRLLAHELAHVVQQRSGTALPSGVGPADDMHERAADRAADAVVAQGPAFAPPPALVPIAERLVRRKREEDEPASAQEEARRLIVEDSAAPATGQMRRKEFVELLDAAVCATSREAMGRLGRSTEGCPLLEEWRPKIRAMGVRQLEVFVRRWTGSDATPRTARDYIPLVTARLAESIRIWGATGQITGIPPDLMDLLAPGKIKVGVGSLIRGAVGSLFRKSRDGGPAPAADVALDAGTGRPLDNGIASRMGRAFGHDFSGVRVHTGAEAAAAAAQVNARAFTVGSEIAFADGEFAPGTLVGDALLAHELAHVAQQDAGPVGPMGRMGRMGPIRPIGPNATAALEHDADDAAVHAVASLWPSVRRFARGVRANAMPALKSSLQLQRCPATREFTPDQKERGGFTQTWQCTPKETEEIRALHPEATARVRAAIEVLSQQKGLDDYDDRLQKHFRTTSANSARIADIRGNYEQILAKMKSQQVEFACLDYTDPTCKEAPNARGYKGAETAVCNGLGKPGGPPPSRITLCGNKTREGDSFLWSSRKFQQIDVRREPQDWIKTLIHEYAHTLCSETGDRGGYTEYYPTMFASGRETYSGDKEKYPSELPQLNADSYASFAMEATKPK
jgi:hypothetical protein